MDISKEAILSKTHYGLHIYAHILKKYFPDEIVLELSGKTCKPAKNPFNNGERSLLISIIDNLAQHIDADNSIPDGNALDFAKFHYKKEEQELFRILIEEMNLKIRLTENIPVEKPKIDISQPTFANKEPKISIPECSYFQNPITNITPLQTMNLFDIYSKIKGIEFVKPTSTLRLINNPKEARQFKAFNFDYVTFSGIFSKRSDKYLLAHSGLLTIDFDHIDKIDKLKENLLNDQYFETELMFVSPSGDGLKWIIPIDLTQTKHQDYFTAVSVYIQKEYKLEIDKSGKDIARACFLPYDEEVYINPKYLK